MILPAIPTETTALTVGCWQTDETTVVVIHDCPGHEEQDSPWGEFLGHATLHGDATEDDVRTVLRSAGWTEGAQMNYTLPNVQATVTTWTR